VGGADGASAAEDDGSAAVGPAFNCSDACDHASPAGVSAGTPFSQSRPIASVIHPRDQTPVACPALCAYAEERGPQFATALRIARELMGTPECSREGIGTPECSSSQDGTPSPAVAEPSHSAPCIPTSTANSTAVCTAVSDSAPHPMSDAPPALASAPLAAPPTPTAASSAPLPAPAVPCPDATPPDSAASAVGAPCVPAGGKADVLSGPRPRPACGTVGCLLPSWHVGICQAASPAGRRTRTPPKRFREGGTVTPGKRPRLGAAASGRAGTHPLEEAHAAERAEVQTAPAAVAAAATAQAADVEWAAAEKAAEASAAKEAMGESELGEAADKAAVGERATAAAAAAAAEAAMVRAAEEEVSAGRTAASAAGTRLLDASAAGNRMVDDMHRATPWSDASLSASLTTASESQSDGGGDGGGSDGGDGFDGSSHAQSNSSCANLSTTRPRRAPQAVTRYEAGAAPGPSELIRLHRESQQHSGEGPAVPPSDLDRRPSSAPRATPVPAQRPLPLGSVPKMAPFGSPPAVQAPSSAAGKSASQSAGQLDPFAFGVPTSADGASPRSGRAERARKRWREESVGSPAVPHSQASEGIAAPVAKRPVAAGTPLCLMSTRSSSRAVGEGFLLGGL
jgi:hypothetical protein